MIPTTEEYEKKWKWLEVLFSQGSIELYAKELRDPHQHDLVFFGEVPSELMKQRKELASHNEDNHTWILVTNMLGGSEWLDEILVIYGVDVIEVDNLANAEARL